MLNDKRLIIFDLDGTLYKLEGGSYNKSPLRQKVLSQAQNFIAKKLSKDELEAKKILDNIQKKYKEEISIGLEKEFKINRYEYFNAVWNIPAKGIVEKDLQLPKTLTRLQKTFHLALVSDAPRIWIDNVLKELEIENLFRGNIFSGEGNERKRFGNTFSKITQHFKIDPQYCIAVGDQQETDIIPAKKIGMKTIFVHPEKLCQVADFNIKSINDFPLTD